MYLRDTYTGKTKSVHSIMISREGKLECTHAVCRYIFASVFVRQNRYTFQHIKGLKLGRQLAAVRDDIPGMLRHCGSRMTFVVLHLPFVYMQYKNGSSKVIICAQSEK